MAIILPYKNIYPKIASSAFIADNAVIIGDVEIGEHASIWYGCVIRGDVSYVRIGEGTNIQDNSVVHVGSNNGPTIIGKGVTVGHSAIIHACVCEDYSFVGMGAKLLDHAVVKSHGMLAAGALLTANKIVGGGEIWSGSPAKFFRKLSYEEIKFIKVSSENYIKLGVEHKNGSNSKK